YPGGAGGKQGSPLTQTAGETFAVQVRAVDQYYNRISTNPTVELSFDDQFAEPAAPEILSGGYFSFGVTLRTSTETAPSPNRVIARQPNDYQIAFGTSSHIPVKSSTPASLLMIVPGEAFQPGNVPGGGKTAAPPAAQVVGSSLTLTVRLVDPFFNRVPNPSPAPEVKILSDAGYSNLPSNLSLNTGETTFQNFYFRIANASPGWRIYASTAAASPLSVGPSTSPYIVVSATTTDRLLLTVPGETYDPGNEAGGGKYGVPEHAIAGQISTVTVRAVDRFFNLKSTDTAVRIVTTDPYAVPPSPHNLQAGATTFYLVFRTATTDPDIAAGPWTVTASTAGSSFLAPSVSPLIDVDAGPAVKLLVLPPGLSYDPGSATGYSGSASTQTAGVNFTVDVKITDAYFNRKQNAASTLQLVSNDPFDDLGTTTPYTSNGKYSFTTTVLHTRNYRDDGVPAGFENGWNITATGTGGYEAGVSTAIPVKGGAADRLVILAYGEQLEEGNVPNQGKRPGFTPAAVTAGAVSTVTVYATDSSYNWDTSTA
ncbi:MAG TPA: hypothetical protein PK523_12100, partial [Elusimicrobiales bacterium]|nr:hypothetical protein [Elusimicrobiales bacterium]